MRILQKKINLRFSFFKLKREFKLGIYTKQNNTIIETAKDYYEGCIHKNLTDNTDDWLGRICSCYALLIKATQGNEAALEIFENILKYFLILLIYVGNILATLRACSYSKNP